MSEDKRKKSAEFAKDKSAFAGDGSGRNSGAVPKAKQKQPGAHQPRDADRTSGHDVQKPGTDRVPEHQNDFQSDAGKLSGQETVSDQKVKSGQRRRGQSGQLPKKNNFTEQKDDSASDDRNTQKDFSQEQNTFMEEGVGENSGERTDSGDGYRRRDTYHQSERKGKYRKRQRQDRERTKQSDFERDFQTGDTPFTESSSFTEGAEPDAPHNKKLNRLQKKAERAGKKTEAARRKLPKRREYSLERVFDEKTGRAKYVLVESAKEKPFQADSPVKRITGRAGSEIAGYAHGKVAETEKENSAVEGAHKSEQKAEDAFRLVKRSYKGKEQRQREKVAKLEKKQFQTEVNFRYEEFLAENPEMQEKTLKKQLQKRLQKQRIKREYAKARRAGQALKDTKEAAVKSVNFTTAAAKKLQEAAAKHASLLVTVAAFVILLIMIMTSVSSCGAMFAEGLGATLAGSYMSVPAEIDAADLAFSELEMELQREIDSIETDYPDYDEYRYNLDAIGHDPFVLISYLSAVHTEFTAAEVQGEIERLFDEMYELTLHPTTETRTGTDSDGEEYEYEVSILEVTLTAKDLSTITAGRMDGEQKEIYAFYNETHGLVQQFYTPLNLYWYNYVSSYYGYRINPVTGQEQFHRGVDIAVPAGTAVLAAMDGTVTTAAYDSYYGNYIVIEDSNGYCTKYAHMDSLGVSAGQTVKHGDTIGTTGNTGSSTGSHLHIECLYNGEYYNPLFYFEAGEGTLYGEGSAPGSGGGNAIPPDSYDDETVQALMEEAARYLGYPYVWGGSSPSTSFDCSGFVCWVFSNSGVHNLPRTTAQGIYNQCTPVSASDAKAGDIIFFTGTYNSGSAVSHVGIYCGNGVMIHAGDPIKYSNINTSYWQSHFYSFGRLSGN